MIKRITNFFRDGIYFDHYLFISITLLSIMGLVFLFSASQGNIETTIKQSFFVFFGLILMFLVSQLDPDFYKSNALIFLLLSIFLLLLTSLTGKEINGAIIKSAPGKRKNINSAFLLIILLLFAPTYQRSFF